MMVRNQRLAAVSPRLLPVLLLLGLGLGWLIWQTQSAEPAITERSPFTDWQAAFTGDADSPLLLAPNPYHHPSNAFNVRYPADWQMDESEDTVLFTAPDETAQFSVTFVATHDPGVDLAGLADSELRRAWGGVPNFTLDPVQPANTRPDQWSATFSFDHALPLDRSLAHLHGLAIFHLQNGRLFTQLFLARAGSPSTLVKAFQAIAESLQINPQFALPDSE
jgi:hypothetical protein